MRPPEIAAAIERSRTHREGVEGRGPDVDAAGAEARALARADGLEFDGVRRDDGRPEGWAWEPASAAPAKAWRLRIA